GCFALRFIRATVRARREPRWKLASLLRVISADSAAEACRVSWSAAAPRTWPGRGMLCGSPEKAGRPAVGGPARARPLPSPQDAGGLAGRLAGDSPACCSLGPGRARPKAYR